MEREAHKDVQLTWAVAPGGGGLDLNSEGDIRTSGAFPERDSGLMGHKRVDVVRRMSTGCVLCVNDA